MDRRKFLSLNSNSKNNTLTPNEALQPMVKPPDSGLAPFSGEWSYATARHLLSRTTYGPVDSEINQCVSLGLQASVEKLFDSNDNYEPPLYVGKEDPNVSYGQTFVDKKKTMGAENVRRVSFLGWWASRVNNARFDISEKLTVFWSNHFSTQIDVVNDARYSYQLYDILRQNYKSNFRELVKKVTVNPAMLVFLNGDRNISRSPNENYARELFELFTVGKGEQIAPGNYTNYTEDDIKAASKVLTGWTIVRSLDSDLNATFVSVFHDKSDKIFSEAFGGATIGNGSENEYESLIDLIFNSQTAAQYIAKKLYIYFVSDYIDESVENNVINPLAQIISEDGYEVENALKILFMSEHFLDSKIHGAIIKPPMDFISATFNAIAYDLSSDDFEIEYRNHYLFLFQYAGALEQILNLPPSVAGWPAFYQKPLLSRMWLNSVTIQLRQKITDGSVYTGLRARHLNDNLMHNLIEEVKKLDNPGDDTKLIEHYVRLLYPVGISEGLFEKLRLNLIPEGSPSYLWSYAWAEYEANPENNQNTVLINFKLLSLFSALFASAEYQIN